MEYNIAPGEVEAFSTMRDAELPYYVVTGHQVHGTKIAKVTDPMTGRKDLEGYDALITDVPGCAIGVRTADCIPVLLYDSGKRLVAAVIFRMESEFSDRQQSEYQFLSKYCRCPASIVAATRRIIVPDTGHRGRRGI